MCLICPFSRKNNPFTMCSVSITNLTSETISYVCGYKGCKHHAITVLRPDGSEVKTGVKTEARPVGARPIPVQADNFTG